MCETCGLFRLQKILRANPSTWHVIQRDLSAWSLIPVWSMCACVLSRTTLGRVAVVSCKRNESQTSELLKQVFHIESLHRYDFTCGSNTLEPLTVEIAISCIILNQQHQGTKQTDSSNVRSWSLSGSRYRRNLTDLAIPDGFYWLSSGGRLDGRIKTISQQIWNINAAHQIHFWNKPRYCNLEVFKW